MKAKDHVQRIARLVAEFFEDQWFDRSRNVRTSGDVALLAAGIAQEQIQDSEYYMPARPAHIRKALRDMPVDDVSSFNYVDLGCGKGRSLFVAAELPLKQILGVELTPVLYQQSCANIRASGPERGAVYRSPLSTKTQRTSNFPKATSFCICSTHLALCNHATRSSQPGQCTKGASVPRVVILLWPRCSDQVAALEGMHLTCETRQYQIFEAAALNTPGPERHIAADGHFLRHLDTAVSAQASYRSANDVNRSAARVRPGHMQ